MSINRKSPDQFVLSETYRWQFQAGPVDILEDIGHNQSHHVGYEACVARYIHTAEMLVSYRVFLEPEITDKKHI